MCNLLISIKVCHKKKNAPAGNHMFLFQIKFQLLSIFSGLESLSAKISFMKPFKIGQKIEEEKTSHFVYLK